MSYFVFGGSIGESGDRNTLQLIPQPAQGFSVFYLKEVVRQAKIFIRPLQRNIDILLDTTISPTFVRIILHVLVYAIRFESIKIVSFACESDIYITAHKPTHTTYQIIQLEFE